jgi:hypothetical protein
VFGIGDAAIAGLIPARLVLTLHTVSKATNQGEHDDG